MSFPAAKDRRTALHLAVWSAQPPAAVRLLLAAGARVAATDSDGMDCLQLATVSRASPAVLRSRCHCLSRPLPPAAHSLSLSPLPPRHLHTRGVW